MIYFMEIRTVRLYPSNNIEMGQAVYTLMQGVCVTQSGLQVSLSADRFWAVRHPVSYHVMVQPGYKKWAIGACLAVGFLEIGIDVISRTFFDSAINYHLECGMATWIILSAVAILVLYGLIFKSLLTRVSFQKPGFEC